MISKKDLSDAEMDTLTKSCSPAIVITANGEVQTHEEAIVYVKELHLFLTMKVLDNTPAVLSLGKLCDENKYSYEWINGQKPHLMKDGIRIICNTENFVPIVVPGLSTNSSSRSYSSTSRKHSRLVIDQGDPMLIKPVKFQKKKPQKERWDPLFSELPEWLQEFRENLVDGEVQEHGDSHASSSHEVSLEPTFKRREDLC